MIKHLIVIASAYSIGKRIALDYYQKDVLQMDVIQKDIDYIYEKCGNDVSISTHFIQTEEIGWDKVVKLDKFFQKAKVVKTKEEFVDILLKDRELKGIDIARYILSKIPCTHLKLQKLVYMCYADYLCEVGSKLFEDKIYAYKSGPVIQSVYEVYKKTGPEKTSREKEDNKSKYNEITRMMPIRSRILASENGVKKLTSIDETLAKYAGCSANQLVEMTHKKSTPWAKVGGGDYMYNEITDEFIIKYHENEI